MSLFNQKQSHSLENLKKNWEGLAKTDPLWAICQDPNLKDNKWDKEAFFKTGQAEVNAVLDYVKALGLNIDFTGPALDFGCGVGRITQAMVEHFQSCDGVDISKDMIDLANKFNKYSSKCHYHINASEKIPIFADNNFNFVYTNNVLQHIPVEYTKSYISEFLRILKPGGVLVFQVPHYYRSNVSMIDILRSKLRLRTRFKKLFGINSPKKEQKCYNVEMNYVPEDIVRDIITRACGKIIDIVSTNSLDLDFNGKLEFIKEDNRKINIARQYCVMK